MSVKRTVRYQTKIKICTHLFCEFVILDMDMPYFIFFWLLQLELMCIPGLDYMDRAVTLKFNLYYGFKSSLCGLIIYRGPSEYLFLLPSKLPDYADYGISAAIGKL